MRGLLYGELVDEHVHGRRFNFVEVEIPVTVTLLPKKIVLLRQAPEDHVLNEVVGNYLPHVFQAYSQVVDFRDKNRSDPGRISW